MNSSQLANFVTSIIQLALGSFAAKGILTHDETETLTSAAISIVTFILSHNWHGSASGGTTGTPKAALLAALILPAIFFTGCASPQKAAYDTVATTSVSVETALHAYDVFAAAGKTTVEQNAAVKAAYLKYQAALAVVCDAGAVYAASDVTNAAAAATGAQAALTQAESNAAQTLADLEKLIESFGVQL